LLCHPAFDAFSPFSRHYFAAAPLMRFDAFDILPARRATPFSLSSRAILPFYAMPRRCHFGLLMPPR